jgi:hypothetical protein
MEGEDRSPPPSLSHALFQEAGYVFERLPDIRLDEIKGHLAKSD